EGRGIAWLPQSLIEAELANGSLVVAGPKAWSIPVEIRMYRQRAEMSDKAEALWDLARKQALA
ncbi:MAG: LysR substrate-binding domain-containing protein, partial [Comamonas sp.]